MQILDSMLSREVLHFVKKEWTISDQEALHILSSPRPNGIDRVDNKKCYVSGNVVSCCKFCNYAKNMNILEEFM